uniref:Carbohydrate binding domain protein n=1 Tax=Siphoviridae sp. ctquf9 TaxID=2826470 RepID=A0A8S5M410_9CAUD|nr:MAG TPA: carbohydrate binding domain protein [Siphoviridae sp. ctquf9]
MMSNTVDALCGLACYNDSMKNCKGSSHHE